MDAGVAVVVAKKNLEDLGKDAAANVGGSNVRDRRVRRRVEDEEEREEECKEEEGALDGDANFISNYLYNGY